MKLNYTYNLMRDYGIDWGRNFREEESGCPNQYHPLQNIENTHYSEIGGLKQENQKLHQQIKDQQELIEIAEGIIKNSFSSFEHAIAHTIYAEKLNTYKTKYQ